MGVTINNKPKAITAGEFTLEKVNHICSGKQKRLLLGVHFSNLLSSYFLNVLYLQLSCYIHVNELVSLVCDKLLVVGGIDHVQSNIITQV